MRRAKTTLKLFAATASLLGWSGANAQEMGASGFANLDPLVAGAAGAVALAIAAVLWAIRVSAVARNQTLNWSRRLSEMETKLEKSDAVLSAHPGLVLVWDDAQDDLKRGWGDPKILGGPAALASLLSFAVDDKGDDKSPADRLLETLSDLPVDDDNAPDDNSVFGQKVLDLRTHGIAFSGSVYTADGRAIEADGRVAGGQVALWLTDPAVRMAEDGSIIGAVRERTTDLHGSHTLLDRAPLPAWRRGADLNLVWVNKAFAQAVEAKSQQDALKSQVELDGAAKKIAETAASSQNISDGRVVVNVHGERRVLRVIEMPMHGAGEAALGGFAIDITEFDKAKADLKQHIAANRSTLDQIPSAVALFGANQDLVYYNNAFKRLWDLEDAELSGKTFHGEILDKLRHTGKIPEQAEYDAWKTGQLALYTEELAAPGSERYGGAPDDIWNLPDGRTLRVARQRHPLGGVVTVFDDITEKMALEAQFNTQLKVQEATLNNLSEAVAVFAGDGSLKLFNEAFEKLWRLSKKALGGNPHIDKVIQALSQKTVKANDQFSALKRCVTSMSYDDRKPISNGLMSLRDGRTFAYGSEPLPDGATLIRFLDVTDSMEREKELKERNAILENADRLKSKFIDHVSYQLRTPLSTIIGFSEMLDGQMFGVLNDRQKDYNASVLSASYHLRDLINDIIDLAAIDAGKMELNRTDTDVRALLDSAATYAALKAEDTQVTLDVDCEKQIGSANLDERRIKQVLFNLLSNAFAYSSDGGVVTLGADRSNGTVRIWVSDTGRGISPEDQAKAFDAFESRGPSAGAGLGLSLVERFIKLHGGWVKLDSQEGKGARVTCYIPEKLAAPEIDEDSQTPAKTAGAKAPALSDEKASATKPAAKDRATATTAGVRPRSAPKKRRLRVKAAE